MGRGERAGARLGRGKCGKTLGDKIGKKAFFFQKVF